LDFREAAKNCVRCIAVCAVSPLGLCERAARSLLGRDVWFASHGELLSLFPGKFGRYLRNAYYWMTLSSCPLDCCFLFGMSFRHSRAVVGHRVYIGTHSLVGLVTIGDDTLIGDHVHLLSGKDQHSFSDFDRRIQDQPRKLSLITIGRNCWVGTNSVLMENIGNHCIIGAGSVVTRRVADGTVAAGNPCRVLRYRQGSPPNKVRVRDAESLDYEHVENSLPKTSLTKVRT
jgi:acetyltransferase-like isoleucine patch superfamily enzyme